MICLNKSIVQKYNETRILINQFLLIDMFEKEHNLFDFEIPERIQNKVSNLLMKRNYQDYELFERKRFHRFEISADGEKRDKYLYFYTEIECQKNEKIILTSICSYRSKIWINGQFVTFSCADGGHYTACNLNKGKNTFVLEIENINCRDYSWGTFVYQIMNYQEEISDYLLSCKQIWKHVKIDECNFIYEKNNCIDEKTFSFAVVPNNLLKYNKDSIITIFDEDNGDELIKVKPFKIYTIDLDLYRQNHPNAVRLGLRIYSNLVCLSLTIRDISKPYELVSNELVNIIAHKVLQTQNKYFLNHFLWMQSWLKRFKPQNDREWDCKKFYELIKMRDDWKSSFKNTDDYFYSSGVHEIYYRSEIDQSDVMLLYRLPKNYDKNKKYPIFYCFAAMNYSWTSYSVDIDLDFIWVDVSLRGLILGSYMSEASAVEAMNICKELFSVNMDQQYLMGYSSGASAVWSFLQNAPSDIAGAYTIGGLPETDKIKNVSNIEMYNPVSDDDFIYERNYHLQEVPELSEKYHQINCTGYIHDNFSSHLTEISIIKELLKVRQVKFPNQIYFTTTRNCHLKSYWIRLHGIEFGKDKAEIYANIVSQDKIVIECKNATGFTLTIPVQISKDNFSVIVNGKVYTYENISSKNIDILLTDKTKKSYKGTGLLNVYRDKMRVIIPEKSNANMYSVAQKYSMPSCNGFISKIYVNYPIYQFSELQKTFDFNMVIIDDILSENNFIRRIRKHAKIKYNKSGFEYNDITYNEDYCLQQIIENPFNKNFCILLISTNNVDLLKKNLFTRKVIIPTYSNGHHKYWNNEALVYYKSKYYSVFEWGDQLKEVSN